MSKESENLINVRTESLKLAWDVAIKLEVGTHMEWKKLSSSEREDLLDAVFELAQRNYDWIIENNVESEDDEYGTRKRAR